MPTPNNDNTIKRLKLMLKQSGIPIGMFGGLMDKAIRHGWTESELLLAIYGSPKFKRLFPGIFRPDGSMKMTPLEYRQQVDEYQRMARRHGIGALSKKQLGKLFGGDVSLQEADDRMTAIERVQEFQPAFDEFLQVLESNGISTKGIDTKQEALKFLLGKSKKNFYQLWDQMAVGTAARVAGAEISQDLVKDISKTIPGVSSEVDLQANMQQLAENLRKVMPLSQIGKYGITDKDLVELQFGGPNQSAIADKVEAILKNRNAENTSQRARTVATQDRAQY